MATFNVTVDADKRMTLFDNLGVGLFGSVLYTTEPTDRSKVKKILLPERSVLIEFVALTDQPTVADLLARFSEAAEVTEIV